MAADHHRDRRLPRRVARLRRRRGRRGAARRARAWHRAARPSGGSSSVAPHRQPPVPAEALAVPADHGRGRDEVWRTRSGSQKRRSAGVVRGWSRLRLRTTSCLRSARCSRMSEGERALRRLGWLDPAIWNVLLVLLTGGFTLVKTGAIATTMNGRVASTKKEPNHYAEEQYEWMRRFRVRS